MKNGLINHNPTAGRAQELFHQACDEIFRKTDQLFAKLMLFQWFAGIVIALVVSPTTWAGQSSQVHIHVWAAIFVGGAISIFPIWMTQSFPGAAVTRHVVAVAQMLMSALLISLTGGRIETHFHVFGSLVILSFYRDWRVLIPATIVVALDHFLRGIYWPYSVYGVVSAAPWRSLEHAAWVMFENVFLVISCLRSVGEMHSIAARTAALETSERGFRQTFEEAPIGMVVVGLDGRIKQANGSFTEMVGFSEAELSTRTTMDITHHDDLEKSLELANAMLDGKTKCAHEKRYIHKGGNEIWATRTACVIRDEASEPQHYLMMVEDISERKQAEKDLAESKRDLEAALHANQLIMDNSQDVICTIDEAGRFVTVNPACEKLWGYTPAELVGQKYIDLVHPEDREKTNRTAADLLLNETVTDFVNRYVRKDGSLVDVLWSASWSETDKTIFCVAHDVTERARVEKEVREAKADADRANHAKSEFLSRMSHELRTPLNAILGFGQLLERQNPTDAQRDRVGYIMSAGRHLLNLINEVLDISRIEAGNLQMSLEPVCVADALSEALDLMRSMAADRSINLTVPPALENGVFVLGDHQRFKQVLLNLLTNAVKYTPEGGSVTVSYAALEKTRMRVVISDTGPGIPIDKLSRLFTPFDRLGAEQSGVEGTGLGLALCQRLMHAMDGSVGVTSTVGQGTAFWVEMPRAESPLERSSVQKREAQDRVQTCAPKRTILYIEDNVSNLALIEQLLEEKPEIELMSAMQGQLGLALARQHSPDLILLDLHLPDLPGWEVLAQLKASDATRNIPVIVISADATKRQIDRLMARGAIGYLTKPLEVQEFFRVIDETLCAPDKATEFAAA